MQKPKPDPAGPGQESVWNYPRPAVAELTDARIVIEHNGLTIADTTNAVRVLETSHPPNYYIPPADIAEGALRRAAGSSYCEWKGAAKYWDVVARDDLLERVGWSYPNPTEGFRLLRDFVAFYAAPFDRCLVNGEEVRPQPGEFYGGWITNNIVGPFKGVPGSRFW
ncbi:DUF427 domain-containing protein [Aurantiacibacter sp. MUD61]|uniref:DUF427 domain-containing protein n=1 Tax=Aurantiacibacter sp. MUD61 TaxID=3009083 RepID=UPI0022F09FF5|nr:DUF427 domain-containing protein [Aurantiacibacter sp. MUD61]